MCTRERAGHWALDDVLDPGELRSIVRVEGVRTAVAMLKRLGVKDAHAVALDALRTGTEYDAVSAGMKIIEAQGFDPTPADNAEVDWRPVFAAEAKFVLRQIAELRRDGYTREARALRDLLPERYAWREWTGTLTERDRRNRANAEALAAAARKLIEQGWVSPFSEGADM